MSVCVYSMFVLMHSALYIFDRHDDMILAGSCLAGAAVQEGIGAHVRRWLIFWAQGPSRNTLHHIHMYMLYPDKARGAASLRVPHTI